jgi:hypothetical protein
MCVMETAAEEQEVLGERQSMLGFGTNIFEVPHGSALVQYL